MCGDRGGDKGEWFPEKIQGEGFDESLSARAGAGMESNFKMSGPGSAGPGAAFTLSLK